MMRNRGFGPIAGAIAGLIIWGLHFTAVYAMTAYVCARGLEEQRVLGFDIIIVAVLGATAVALLAAGFVLFRALRRLRHSTIRLAGEGSEHDPQFLTWFSAAAALLAIVAILYQGVPTLLVPPCA